MLPELVPASNSIHSVCISSTSCIPTLLEVNHDSTLSRQLCIDGLLSGTRSLILSMSLSSENAQVSVMITTTFLVCF